MLCTVPVRHPSLHVDIKLDCEKDYIPDYNTLLQVTNAGTPEPEVVDVLTRVLKPGDTAIDGGANIGYFTMLMAHLVGRTGQVLAFEPGPDNLQKLLRNVEINEASQVRVIDQPLWHCTGLEMPLYYNADPGQHALQIPEKQTVDYFNGKKTDAITTTIDNFGLKPKLIKLDIEGAEWAAIKGAAKTIRWHQPFVVCEFNHKFIDEQQAEDFRSYMAISFGYATFALYQGMPLPVYLPHNCRINSTFENTNVLFATPTMVGQCWPEIIYVEKAK